MIFYAAAVLFLATFVLGVLVQFGVLDTKPFRWVHHALFFAVFASAALAVVVGFLQEAVERWKWRARPRWALLPALAVFAVLPRVRAGTPGHAALAFLAMIFYAIGCISLL